MSSWLTETYEGQIAFGLKIRRSLYAGQSALQRIEIVETEPFGRVLVLDGVFQTSEVDEHLYHEMLAHPACTACRRPRRVLIIGGGDGGTARQVLRHDEVESVVLVEIDGEVIRACREHLPALGAWDDPRLEVVIGDGLAFLDDGPANRFDVILVDGTDPVGPGEALFGSCFISAARRALHPGGIFAQQSASPLLQRDIFVSTVTRLGQHFAQAHPYFGPVPLYAAGLWSWTVAADEGDPRSFDRDRAERIARACRYYNADIHEAAFARPQSLRAQG